MQGEESRLSSFITIQTDFRAGHFGLSWVVRRLAGCSRYWVIDTHLSFFITRELFLPECTLDAHMYRKNNSRVVWGRGRGTEREGERKVQIRHAEFGRVHR